MAKEYIYRVDIQTLDSTGTPAYLSYASRPYSTDASHPLLPNKYFEGRVIQPLLFQRNLFGANQPYGIGDIASGQVVISNSDGSLDSLASSSFDGYLIEVWRTDFTNPNTDFLIFRGRMEAALLDDDNLTITVRDMTYYFDFILQQSTYQGTNILPNGQEGVATDLKGKPKPVLVGKVFNIEPILVNTARLEYQVGDSASAPMSTSSDLVVRDMGVPLTREADYASVAFMDSQQPSAGAYRVCNDSTGIYFRLGSTPAGTVTCDVTNTYTGGPFSASTTFAACIGRLYQQPQCVDDRTHASVGFGNTGFYWSEQVSFLDAYHALCQAVGACMHVYPDQLAFGIYGGPSRPQYLTLQRATIPAVGATPLINLDLTNNILADTLKKIQPDTTERGVPPWRVNVSHTFNYTVMGRDELAGSVSDSDVQYYSQDFRKNTDNSSSSIHTANPRAPELEAETHLVSDSEAITFGAYMLDLTTTGRQMFSVTIPVDWDEISNLTDTTASIASGGPASQMNGLILNSVVKLTVNRFGLNAGKLFTLIGFAQDYHEGTVELILWG